MNELLSYLKQFDIENAEEKSGLLMQYMQSVLEWNEKVNLTAITDTEEFVQKHFIDSLLCAESLEFTASSSICDVGTGGGFPGVPLAVCYPDKEFLLMDSLAKRVRIVNDICAQLGVTNVTVVHGRAEELARQLEYRDRFDLCVSRAVANMRVLSEYCLPFVRAGGTFIAYKGPDCESEINDARRAVRLLGGEEPEIRKTSHLDHSLVFVRKSAPTPDAYPRKAGVPAKKPL